MRRKVMWVIVSITVLICATAVLTLHSYSSVSIKSAGDGWLTVEFNPDWPGTGQRPVAGVSVNLTVDVRNSTLVTLWSPKLDHEVFIGDEYITSTEPTPSMLVGPWAKKSVPVYAFVPREALTRAILELISSGGSVEVKLESSGKVAGMTFTYTSTASATVRNPVKREEIGGLHVPIAAYTR